METLTFPGENGVFDSEEVREVFDGLNDKEFAETGEKLDALPSDLDAADRKKIDKKIMMVLGPIAALGGFAIMKSTGQEIASIDDLHSMAKYISENTLAVASMVVGLGEFVEAVIHYLGKRKDS